VSLLEKINSPADLQQLTLAELEVLAAEIRNEVVSTVSRNGGHLAPNLGVVELTLALHTTFDSPNDQIVWDVGHQAYIHKLLTGRRKEFATLRQYKGMSGFLKRTESPHDVFGAGHSSTSISAAMGLAKARDINRLNHSVVAVIGDGAMTGGMAFEALNHAGHLGSNLIVVLNDNEMSIAANVGALSSYLSRMRIDPKYYKGKAEIKRSLQRIPAIGSKVVKVFEKAKDGLKYALVPGVLFEELGFTYLGPIDGHNITEVRRGLSLARDRGGPVLVHVLTIKGKGYKPAEENPDKFHGVGPFEVKTGQLLKKDGPPSYTQVFGETLVELGREYPNLVAITAAMPDSTGLSKFAQEFPERCMDVGIAEQHAVTMAAAMGLQGFKPVVAIYSTFLQRAYDQILHDVALQRSPVIFVIDRAGVVGDDGPTHHGVFDISLLRHIPGLVIMAPKNENELRHMLKTAVEHDGPIVLRYPRSAGKGVKLDKKLIPIPLGRAEVLREGRDVTLIGVGPMANVCMEAASVLNGRNVFATVINPRFLKPLDEERIVFHGRKTGRIVTVEDHALAGGFGSAVLELLDKYDLNIPVIRLGYPDEFVEHASIAQLHDQYGLSVDGIVKAVNRLTGNRMHG